MRMKKQRGNTDLADLAKKEEEQFLQFLSWALDSTDVGKPNEGLLRHTERKNLLNICSYIQAEAAFTETLLQVENMARAARFWRSPWPEQWPVGNLSKPVCPRCGAAMIKTTTNG